MPDEQPEASALRVFKHRIKELYERAGAPKPTVVNQIVGDLEEFYPLMGGRSTLPTSVGRSTLNQVVNGVRLPSASMLAVIVLALGRCGRENGGLAEDPGPSALGEWHRLLREAKAEESARARAGSGGGGGARTARAADPVRLEPGERAVLDAHGPYASALAARAERGDRDAVYEIAVLLACGTGRGLKAAAYLVNAAAAGQSAAPDLLPADDGEVDGRLARAHAHALAYAAGRYGDEDAARAFRSCGAAPEARPPRPAGAPDN
ncbi:hypothetical protein BKA00_006873 [Actinomadura coerulea]|uniref:Uncharacterized protein n=1 Tax=Actinomadura coerulea TaxID=46159 RepID=A0A7X0G694_9ACTN|nr:hypothetical protein [Actinomadura coerulea]MBB6399959.1 hypothetical protein [Actinomadura coerulea]GGQ17234.1 hypothetical protein GCM10010187_36940 [Actinomadura coerulea]